MTQAQISRQHHRARRRQDDDQFLTADLLDPDIVRAKRLMKGAAASRTSTGRGKTT